MGSPRMTRMAENIDQHDALFRLAAMLGFGTITPGPVPTRLDVRSSPNAALVFLGQGGVIGLRKEKARPAFADKPGLIRQRFALALGGFGRGSAAFLPTG